MPYQLLDIQLAQLHLLSPSAAGFVSWYWGTLFLQETQSQTHGQHSEEQEFKYMFHTVLSCWWMRASHFPS